MCVTVCNRACVCGGSGSSSPAGCLLLDVQFV